MMGDHSVWISCGSHRARHALWDIAGDLPSYGVWPKDGGWPRGEFYAVPVEHLPALSRVKGLRILAGTPRGKLFKRAGR